jgi:hypothetical protein
LEPKLGNRQEEAALGNGHEVTLFNRGRHSSELYPQVEQVRDAENSVPPDKGAVARAYGAAYGALKALCEQAAEEASFLREAGF